MRKTLLLAACAAIGFNAFSQCIPNQLYADSVYGVWPDTITNFRSGTVGVFYSDTMQLLVPTNAGLINPTFNGFNIDSVALVGISGLPPGIEVICHSQTAGPCTYITGQVGCGLLEGTPTQTGTFPLEVNVIAYLRILGTTQGIPQSFGNYKIVIHDNTTAVEDVADLRMGRVQNVPNPFADRTTIEFSLSRAANAKVKVYNLVGEKLWNRSIAAKAGLNRVPFEMNELENGIYIYRVEAGTASFTGRMVVNR